MYYRYLIAAVLLLALLLSGKALLNLSTASDQLDNLTGTLDNSNNTTSPQQLPGFSAGEKTEGELSEELVKDGKTEGELSEELSAELSSKEGNHTVPAISNEPEGNDNPANTPVLADNNLPTHKVVQGESLFLVSRHYGVTVNELRRLNNLTSDEILAGQVLTLPAGAKPQAQVMQTASRNSTARRFTENDVYWLAKIINAEARGENYEGQVAVGAVVLNRVRSSNFPNTVYGVIFEKWDGKYYQFSPVLDGSINLEPNQTAYKAARDAINGWDPSGGALYFYNPETSTNRWIFDRPIIKKIGKHVFAL
jgi:N-acetylmuramoyl-L-alanine amidase